ncbi:hypothetical protein ACIBG0_36185 [Nocardia sp. NPDC050630]|uniref:hypothetical protein n=1 Tax=unclassified Nocardia TaxID=2637762 RepID=UPI0037B623FC
MDPEQRTLPHRPGSRLPHLVEKITRATGVRINEADYPHLASIDYYVDFLTTAG